MENEEDKGTQAESTESEQVLAPEPFVQKAFKQLERELPATTLALRGLDVTSYNLFFAIVELLTMVIGKGAYDSVRGLPVEDPIDRERWAFREAARLHGLDGMQSIGGGIFAGGAELEEKETVTDKLFEHMRDRVKESYDKGYAAGREALLKEQAEEAALSGGVP